MLMKELYGKRVAVWGLGTEGKGILTYLRAHNLTENIVLLSDNQVQVPDGFENCPLYIGQEIKSALEEIDIIIRSPGISIYKEEFKLIKNKGIKVTSISDLFLTEMRVNKPNCPVIGISGSKGKSISVSSLAFMLKGLGYKVGLGGNIGRALTELLDDDYDFIVAEFSSYQASDLSVSPNIAMFTNLFFVHSDWHRGHENYCRDKIHLITNQKAGDVFFVNERNLQLVEFTDEFSENRRFYNNCLGFYAKERDFYYQEQKLFGLDELKLFGNHNLDNLAGVFSILKYLNLDIDKAIEILKEFETLPHRLQKVAVKDGVIFINDSISTAPEAAVSAIKSFKENLALISGGQDTKQDYSEYAQSVEDSSNVKYVATLFQTGPQIMSALKKKVTRKDVVLSEAKDLESAVKAAYECLKTKGGGIVLFSPTSPSFGFYKNFIERGEHFIKIVDNLL